MTRQVVIDAFGKPDRVRASGNREYFIYQERGFFIGFSGGEVATYGDLKDGREEIVPEPKAEEDWQTHEAHWDVPCVRV